MLYPVTLECLFMTASGAQSLTLPPCIFTFRNAQVELYNSVTVCGFKFNKIDVEILTNIYI